MTDFIQTPPINTKILVEYIWLDSNMKFRSKSKLLNYLYQINPEMNY